MESFGHESASKDPHQKSLEHWVESSGRQLPRILTNLLEIKKMNSGKFSLGTLEDLFASQNGRGLDGDGNTKPEFCREDGHPYRMMIRLVRDIIILFRNFDSCGITHWDVKPSDLCLTAYHLPLDPEKSVLQVTPSEELLKKGPENYNPQAPYLFVALGRLLFFCITGGSKTDSRPTKVSKTSSNLSAPEQATKNDVHIIALKNPEAIDLIQTLLDASPDKRYLFGARLDGIVNHPFFWNDHIKFVFMCEASRAVIIDGRQIFRSLIEVASDALRDSIDESDPVDVMKLIDVMKVLEQALYKCYYLKNLQEDIAYELELGGKYMKDYPRLYFELYKVMREHDVLFISEFCHQQSLY